MVQGLLRTLETSVRGVSKQISSLHQAAYLLAALTLVSQVLALLRDRLFAHSFGASTTLDAYYAAFKVPDLVFALVASLVSAYVLIPRIAGTDRAAVKKLLSHASSFLLIGGSVIAAILYVAMPSILGALFPGITDNGFVALSRLLLLQPILLGFSGIVTSVTQVERRFFLFALSPVLYNLGIIGGALFLYPSLGLQGVGIGVVAGALLHVAIHLPVLAKGKVLPQLVIPSPRLVWSIAKDSVPRSLALSFGAFTTLALAILASRVGEGSMSLLSLAGNLEAVPLALIGASYATAAFPVLSEEANRGKDGAFRATLIAAGRHLLFWSAVVAVLAIVLRAHLVRVIYGTGAFDWDATRLAAALLAVLIVGLAAQGFVLLASRAFYALRRSYMPLVLQVVGLAASVGSALFLLSFSEQNPELLLFLEALLRIEELPGTEIVLVALGATIGQLIMGAGTLLLLARLVPGTASALARPLFEGTAAGIVGGTAAYGLLSVMGNLAPLTTFWSVFTQGLVAGMVGLAASAAVLALLENREFRDLADALRKIAVSKALLPSGAVLSDRGNP